MLIRASGIISDYGRHITAVYLKDAQSSELQVRQHLFFFCRVHGIVCMLVTSRSFMGIALLAALVDL